MHMGHPLRRHMRGGRSRLTRRTMKRSKSVVDLLLFGGKDRSGADGDDDPGEPAKSKNIRQTEVIVSLRDSIVRVAQYFQAADPAAFPEVNLNADYSMDGHARDHDVFLAISRR